MKAADIKTQKMYTILAVIAFHPNIDLLWSSTMSMPATLLNRSECI